MKRLVSYGYTAGNVNGALGGGLCESTELQAFSSEAELRVSKGALNTHTPVSIYSGDPCFSVLAGGRARPLHEYLMGLYIIEQNQNLRQNWQWWQGSRRRNGYQCLLWRLCNSSSVCIHLCSCVNDWLYRSICICITLLYFQQLVPV